MKNSRGYTLIELVVAVGLFALIMTLVSGAYIMMIGLTERAQGTASGIDNLSFALEAMTRNIRTGTNYSLTGPTFSFDSADGASVSYSRNGSVIQQSVGGADSILTDPSVTVTELTFFLSGEEKPPADYQQPYVIIVVAGTVSAGHGRTEAFRIKTSAVMRGTDL